MANPFNYCMQCGAKIPGGARFCNVCGTPQTTSPAASDDLQQSPGTGAGEQAAPVPAGTGSADNHTDPYLSQDEEDESFHIEPPAIMRTGSKQAKHEGVSFVHSSGQLPDDPDEKDNVAQVEEPPASNDEPEYNPVEEKSAALNPPSPPRRTPPMPPLRPRQDLQRPIDVTPDTPASAVSVSENTGMALMLPPQAQWAILAAILERCEIKVSSPADYRALKALGITLSEPVENPSVEEDIPESPPVSEELQQPVPPPIQRQQAPQRPAAPQRPVQHQQPVPQQQSRAEYPQSAYQRQAPQQQRPQQRPAPSYQQQPPQRQSSRQPAPQRQAPQQQRPQQRRQPVQQLDDYYDDYDAHADDDYYSDIQPMGDVKKKSRRIDKDTLIKCVAVGLAAIVVIAVIFIVLPRL